MGIVRGSPAFTRISLAPNRASRFTLGASVEYKNKTYQIIYHHLSLPTKGLFLLIVFCVLNQFYITFQVNIRTKSSFVNPLPLVGLAMMGLHGTLGSEFPASLTARILYSYSFPSVTFSSSNSQSQKTQQIYRKFQWYKYLHAVAQSGIRYPNHRTVSYRNQSSVDGGPSVGLGLFPLHDVALDRVPSVVLRRFPGNCDVIPVLFYTLRLAGWEGLIYSEESVISQ